MQIKKYAASSIQEALKQIKKELGPEALILSVNNIKAKSGPLALMSPARVEVTAAIDEAAAQISPYPAGAMASRVKPKEPNHPSLSSIVGLRPERHFPDLQKVTQGAKQIAQNVKETLSSWRGKNTNHQGQPMIGSLCHLLKNIGLQEDIVEHIFDVLNTEIPHSEQYNSLRLEGLAKDILQQLVKTSGPIEVNSHQPKYVALVGPTGTGKTTTIAKLSAELLLKKKKKVSLITIDTYRVAALEQLNTYAGIMNIPVKLASTFEQMRKAMLQYHDQDVVLIDTAGFSHHDREHLQLLNAFLAQVTNPEIHLVLSINTSEKELIHISQKFNLLRYKRLLFTKLDESSYPGTIFNHMVYTGKPISYITTGQKVPEDIELATPEGIINLMFQKKPLQAPLSPSTPGTVRMRI